MLAIAITLVTFAFNGRVQDSNNRKFSTTVLEELKNHLPKLSKIFKENSNLSSIGVEVNQIYSAVIQYHFIHGNLANLDSILFGYMINFTEAKKQLVRYATIKESRPTDNSVDGEIRYYAVTAHKAIENFEERYRILYSQEVN